VVGGPEVGRVDGGDGKGGGVGVGERDPPGEPADALRRLVAYDRRRQAELCRTLEEYLARRGNISATAQALYVHPNTLRQRLRRIEEITGLDVREGEWLMIEIALKLLRLEALEV